MTKMTKHTIDTAYFPGWTRKSVTFTIDDGNIPMDEKFLSIVKPYGILGTFNLCADRLTAHEPEWYREFYLGYEIANHVKFHPYAMKDGESYTVTDEPFAEATANPDLLYPYRPGEAGVYYIKGANGWRRIADGENYLRLARESFERLNEIFLGTVKDFVWPFTPQQNETVQKGLRAFGYRSLRAGGARTDTEGFSLPRDRMHWSYNANHTNLLETMAKYEAFPDDGALKMFAIGVHSVDYEKAGKWGELEAFAKAYGCRPEDYYYASVGDILAYEDACHALVITDTEIRNPSDVTLYLTVDGKRLLLRPRSSVVI